MKSIMFILLISLSVNLFSQTFVEGQKYGMTDKDTISLLYNDVKLRNAPGTNEKIIQKLKIGTFVKIKSKTEKTLTINGFSHYWYKITVLNNNMKETGITGFIWGGFIADAIVASKQDPGVHFVYGISKINKDEITIQVRAFRDTSELSKIEFKAIGSLTTSNSMVVYNNKGLNNVTNILEFNFSDNMCAGAFGTVYVFWDKRKLIFVKTLTEGADAPVFSSADFIFPNDKGGKKGKIIFKEESGEILDDGKTKYDYQRETEFIWNGNTLQKVK